MSVLSNPDTDYRTQKEYKSYAEGAEQTTIFKMYFLRLLRNLCVFCGR